MMLSSPCRSVLFLSKSSCRRCYCSAIRKNETYDVVVNGGGIVGLSLLAALSASPHCAGRRILLLEQQAKKIPHAVDQAVDNVTISNRVTSLTKASKRFYKDMGIWSPELEDKVKKCNAMYVWSEDFRKGITFSSTYPGLFDLLPLPSSCNDRQIGAKDEAVCYFVENHVLMNAIERVVPSDWIRYDASVTDVKAEGSDVIITIDEEGETLRSKLLIGCDGYHSLVRRKSTLDYFEYPLQQNAIVGTIEMDDNSEDNEIAFQRFLQDETVIGLLPITRTHCSFVISTSKARAHMLMQLDEEEFVEAMNALLSMRDSVSSKNSVLTSIIKSVDEALDRVLPKPGMPPVSSVPGIKSLVPTSRASFPLSFGTTVPQMVGSPKGSKNNKIAIIGDASHRIPPLAGQGLNLGIGDAIELAECLTQPLERGDPVFDNNESLVRALNRFERNRQFKIIPILAAVAAMQKAFHLTPPSILSQVNKFSSIKSEIVKFANSR